jgi:hypothetical protein
VQYEEAERAGKGTTGDKGSFMAEFMGSARTPTCRARRPSGGKSGGRQEEMQTENGECARPLRYL